MPYFRFIRCEMLFEQGIHLNHKSNARFSIDDTVISELCIGDTVGKSKHLDEALECARNEVIVPHLWIERGVLGTCEKCSSRISYVFPAHPDPFLVRSNDLQSPARKGWVSCFALGCLALH